MGMGSTPIMVSDQYFAMGDSFHVGSDRWANSNYQPEFRGSNTKVAQEDVGSRKGQPSKIYTTYYGNSGQVENSWWSKFLHPGT